MLYRSVDGSTKNLHTDEIVAFKAIRGKEIGPGSKCPTSTTHAKCGGATTNYACDSDGFITDVSRMSVNYLLHVTTIFYRCRRSMRRLLKYHPMASSTWPSMLDLTIEQAAVCSARRCPSRVSSCYQKAARWAVIWNESLQSRFARLLFATKASAMLMALPATDAKSKEFDTDSDAVAVAVANAVGVGVGVGVGVLVLILF